MLNLVPMAEFQAGRVGGSIHFCDTRFKVASKGAIQGEGGCSELALYFLMSCHDA